MFIARHLDFRGAVDCSQGNITILEAIEWGYTNYTHNCYCIFDTKKEAEEYYYII
jgi:hypothetical protein